MAFEQSKHKSKHNDSLEDRIAFCDEQITQCQRAAGDESLPLWDRVGAQVGELDWLVERELLREQKYTMLPAEHGTKQR